jgi:tRNA threonylcarbamoyladenosine modification (KEOPS) complex Cgi121 subunit
MKKKNMYTIFGAKGFIKNKEDTLNKISIFAKKNDIIIQVFDADIIYGKNHLISSIKHALRSLERGKNTTNSIAMEIILYSSGERQLKLAIPKMGIKNYKNKIIFILFKEKNNLKNINNLIKELLKLLSLKRCDNVLNGNKDKLKKFGINKHEIKTISNKNFEKLIMEKVALVDIIK